MKIDTLITKLEKLSKRFGNVDVQFSYEGREVTLTSLEVFEFEKPKPFLDICTMEKLI